MSGGFTGSLTGDAGESPGTYAIRQGTLALGTNYTLTFAGASMSISPRTASVTPNSAGKAYGSADPALSGTLSGFLAADSVAAIFSRTPGENVGTYSIGAAL